MGELVVTTFVTVDGVMQAPGGREEDTSGGFEHGGWQMPLSDEGTGSFVEGVFERPAAFLLGRRTYEIFASYWPKQTGEDNAIAAKLNALPKYVASRTLESPEWEPTTVIRDAATELPAVKERVEGELHVWGSASLVQALYEHGLVDRHHIVTYPLVLGTGKRLFEPGAAPSTLRLVESHATAKGTVISTYERAGNVEYEDVPSS
jgi:dihydrofolate reductase